MLFNFCLTPLENVVPWGNENNLCLHWFGLTDGCYWLHGGEAEIFRYHQKYLDAYIPQYNCQPYVDYYVVRLWEDLLDILPDILVPVPAILAEKLTAPNLLAFQEHTIRWIETKQDDKSDDIYEQATIWYQARRLNSSYLVHGPTIWFWSDGTNMHIEWDNHTLLEEGIPVWETQVGSWSLSIEEFLEEVRSFDREFIQAMQIRVDQISTAWPRADVRIDKHQLVMEHADRSKWLEKSLNRAFQGNLDDWSTILKAISLIESDTQI